METTLFLPCAKGSEALLAEEIKRLGFENCKISPAVVKTQGNLESAYRLCLWSRLASRVLWTLAEGEVSNPQDMYDLAFSINWEEHLSADTTFAIHFNGLGQGIKNTQFGALKIKDALVDYLRQKLHRRPNVDAQNPDIKIDVHLRKGYLTIALDLSGGGLHQRSYRQQQGSASLKETLAATLLYRSGWAENFSEMDALIDPMCGSGTIVLEALLMAADIAPALQRPHFGFEAWMAHKPALWKRFKEEALARREAGLNNLDLKIYAFDENPQVLNFARQNAEALGLSHCIHFEKRSVQQLIYQKSYGQKGLIISNPPYGERLGTLTTLLPTYEALGTAFKTFPKDWNMTLISSNSELLKRLRLRSHKTYQAFNGALETEIVLYQREQQNEEAEAVRKQLKNPHNSMIYSTEQAKMFANRLRKNFNAAQKQLKNINSNAYRVYDQDMPEYAVAIDIYGDFVHIQEYAPPPTVAPEKARKRLLDVLSITPEVLGIAPQNIVLKTRERQSGNAQYNKINTQEDYFSVQEGAAKFWVNLHDYLDTGLFLDHRAMRRKIYQEADGKRFLNLFSYTGTASVQAALGGASFTTSVDLSQNYLDWAHRNFDLNELNQRHRLIKADVMAWLAEGDSEFDLIFCDPPTFSNTKKKQRTFDVQSDHEKLLNLAMKRLSDDGTLYFSTNYRRFKLSAEIQEKFAVEALHLLDFDFARRPNIHYVWCIQKRK